MDHYCGFSHPVVVELSAQARGDLFSQMHRTADKLRLQPAHVPDDDQIAFRMLQRIYGDHLTRAQWLDLFAEWRDLYRARCERVSASPDAIARIDVRLCEIGDEIASTFEARDGRAVATLP
jgi:hypothetical protein